MTQFRKERPNQETRLRQWPGGRVNQLRLMLSHLETAVNNSLAAQVLQGPDRKFSQFVPKIPPQNITSEINYREIRLIFTPPRGLRKFLSYEMQSSRFENFQTFQSFTSPEPVFTFTALEPGVTFYFRIRVVTTDGEVGPWSDTVVETALRARASSLFDNRRVIKVKGSLSPTVKNDTFTDILEVDHDGVGGVLFYMCNFNLLGKRSQGDDHNLSWSDVEFRWLENNVQVGRVFGVTVYSVRDSTSGLGDDIVGDSSLGSFVLGGPLDVRKTGTFSQKAHAVQSGTITIKLQAKLRRHVPRANRLDWLDRLDSNFTAVKFSEGFILQIRGFSTFEYIVES